MKCSYVKFVAVIGVVLLMTGLSWAGENTVAGKNSKVTLDGVVFAKYFYTVAHHDAAMKSFNGFEVERVYATAKYKMADNYMFRFTTDLRRYGDLKGGTEQPLLIVVKYAYLEMKGKVPNGTIVFGQQGAPIVGFLEKQWGFRSVFKVMADKDLGISSTYLGVGLKGTVAARKVSYGVMLANGNKWRKQESDKYKALLGRVTVNPTSDVALSGLLKVNANASPSSDHMDSWFGGSVAYKADKFAVGGDVLLKTDKKGPGKDDVKGQGISVYGRVMPRDKYALFGRADIVDKNTDQDNDAYNRIIVGLAINLAKKVKEMVVLNMTTYEEDGKDADVLLEYRLEIGL